MNTALGLFTVPVPGIYHFEVSALKDKSAHSLAIFLQVNDYYVAATETAQSSLVITGSYDTVSLTASLRLKANDRVQLVNWGKGAIHDNTNHHTQFTGWLVEEDL